MEKYNKWHNLKSNIDALDTRPEFRHRDIWFCHLGINIGDEENGSDEGFIRPVVVIRKFNSNLCWVIPLTRTHKDSPYYSQFSFIGSDSSTAILSQVRTVDSKRLRKKIGYISKKDFVILKEKFKALLP